LSDGVAPPAPDPFHPNLHLQLGAGRIDGPDCMQEALKLASVLITIELHPDPEPGTPPRETPPARPSLSTPEIDESSPTQSGQPADDFEEFVRLLKSEFYLHVNNGSGEIKNLNQLMATLIASKKSFRFSVEP